MTAPRHAGMVDLAIADGIATIITLDSPANRNALSTVVREELDELARETDLGAYADWTDTERIVGNLHRAYADLTVAAEDRGGPIDFPGALGDMVTYDGGRPLTCLA